MRADKFDFDYDIANGVATITLNRPEVLNALTFEIYAQLRDLNTFQVVIESGWVGMNGMPT